MIVQNIQLSNFRNYDKAFVSLHPALNLITGNNAQGKTNLLESLVYLSLTRSHRISDDKKLIKNGAMFADIQCKFEDEGIIKDIEAVIHGKGKTLMIHKQPVKKTSEFIGLLNVVLFSPDDLRLFNDSPKERRRVLNQEITKISPKYLLSLNKYQNLLKERNILLKEERKDELFLETLDEQMAEEEEKIMLERKRFIQSVNEMLTPVYQQLSSDTIQMSIVYKSCIDDISKENLFQMHQSLHEKDRIYHTTTNGIHREDMIFEMDHANLILSASQGQKRMTMLAFKMALLKHIQKETGKNPVLLLDDVLSELDMQKQNKLLKMIDGTFQCLITSTEIPPFLKNKDLKNFYVEDGKIYENRRNV